MTKKDYELIAKGLNRGFWLSKGKISKDTKIEIVHALAIELELDNPRFDYQKFLNKAVLS